MAYNRQTSFSPFSSKRNVSTKEAKDQATLAKALESQRKQSVKEFAGASSQQIEELSRIDRIARQKDEYEIQNLARFSQSLNSALQTGAKLLGKQYIEGQKEKGADAFANDPFDPLSIEQEISTLRDKNLTIIDEIEKSENEKRILDLEEKVELQEEKVRLHGALCSFSDSSLLGRALEISLSDKIRAQDSIRIIVGVSSSSLGRSLAWDFVRNNWKEIDNRYGDGGFALNRLVSLVSGFSEEKRISEVEDFFEKNPTPAAERSIQQALERIRLNTAWKKKFSSEISSFLTK